MIKRRDELHTPTYGGKKLVTKTVGRPMGPVDKRTVDPQAVAKAKRLGESWMWWLSDVFPSFWP